MALYWVIIMLGAGSGTTIYSPDGTIDHALKFGDRQVCEAYLTKIDAVYPQYRGTCMSLAKAL